MIRSWDEGHALPHQEITRRLEALDGVMAMEAAMIREAVWSDGKRLQHVLKRWAPLEQDDARVKADRARMRRRLDG